MAFRPDQVPLPSSPETISSEQYYDMSERIGALLDFMQAGSNWNTLDPIVADIHRTTLKSLERAQQTSEYAGLSLTQAAEALIKRFDHKAGLAAAQEHANRKK